MEVNIHHAKTNLSKLIAAVESGEEVIIARNGKPVVKLVVVPPPAKKSRRHMLGAWEGRGIVLPTDEEWAAMDKEVEDLMLNSPLFPPDEDK
jgi:prevent-host-death family protein